MNDCSFSKNNIVIKITTYKFSSQLLFLFAKLVNYNCGSMCILKRIYRIFPIFLCFLALQSSAQDIPVKKFKPPIVETSIGIRTDSSKVVRSEGVQLPGLPLTVKDSTGRKYAIVTYQFLYKRIGYIEDMETGNVRKKYSVVSQRFETTPLPKVWVDNIDRQLQSGEEFFFFDILVKDDKNREFYAPNLRIIIE